ncbi:MAG: hypothetical protein ACJAZ8_000676 [Planctomycetota bacterium]
MLLALNFVRPKARALKVATGDLKAIHKQRRRGARRELLAQEDALAHLATGHKSQAL